MLRRSHLFFCTESTTTNCMKSAKRMIRNDLDSREVKDFKVSEKIREALKQIATLSLVNNYLIPFILIKR